MTFDEGAPAEALLDVARRVLATGYRFVTPTPATIARVNARAGNAHARDLHGVFGWSRPIGPGALPPDLDVAMTAAGLVDAAGRSTVRLSTLDGMLFAHSAYPTTADDAVFFGPDTYRFARAIRPLLERPIRRAIDVGTGAGPGALLIARAHPSAEVIASDINRAALRMARANAALNGIAIEAVQSDLFDAIPGEFDLIVSNPPYMNDPAARAYRHGGGPLGAALSLRILQAALPRLAPGGTLLLYTGAAITTGQDPFLDAASAHLSGTGLAWSYEEIDPDVFGEELETPAYDSVDRIAAVALTVTNKEAQNARR